MWMVTYSLYCTSCVGLLLKTKLSVVLNEMKMCVLHQEVPFDVRMLRVHASAHTHKAKKKKESSYH